MISSLPFRMSAFAGCALHAPGVPPAGTLFISDSLARRHAAFVSRGHTQAACVMADSVKPKRLYRCLDGPDFVFDLLGLHRLVAPRAWPAGSDTGPKPRGRLSGNLSPCDPLTCGRPCQAPSVASKRWR